VAQKKKLEKKAHDKEGAGRKRSTTDRMATNLLGHIKEKEKKKKCHPS